MSKQQGYAVDYEEFVDGMLVTSRTRASSTIIVHVVLSCANPANEPE